MVYGTKKTDTITLEGRTFEVELNPHRNRGLSPREVQANAPIGWQIAPFWLLKQIRNSKSHDKFSLTTTFEFVQTPDNVPERKEGYAAWFVTGLDGSTLVCCCSPVNYNLAGLPTRLVREIS
jgi:hypothetical protein